MKAETGVIATRNPDFNATLIPGGTQNLFDAFLGADLGAETVPSAARIPDDSVRRVHVSSSAFPLTIPHHTHPCSNEDDDFVGLSSGSTDLF